MAADRDAASESGVDGTTAASRLVNEGAEAGVAPGDRQDARPGDTPKVGDVRSAATKPHFSVDFEDEQDGGWWRPLCNCGWEGGLFPGAEDACDALMQHAYEQGILDERKGHVPR